MSRILIIFLFVVSTAYAETKIEALNKAYNTIDDGYPFTRYMDGSTSLIFGSLAAITGFDAVNRDRHHTTEKFTGYALIGVGSVRVIDSIILFSTKSRVEKDVNSYRSLPNSKNKVTFGETRLSINARRSFKMRMIRSSLITATAIGYLNLFFMGRDEYKVKGYVGFMLIGIAAWKFLKPYPEEKAWTKYNSQFYIIPGKDNLSLLYNITF